MERNPRSFVVARDHKYRHTTFCHLSQRKKCLLYQGDWHPATVEEVVISECLSRINLEADNTKFFNVLNNVTTVDITHIQTILSNFLKKLDHEKNDREKNLTDRIKEKGFSGSAVLPNLKSDPEWIDFVEETKTRFREELQNLGRL